MKQIVFIRHAKSDWNHPELSDIDRPLNKRGNRDAPDMGRRLKLRNEKVDHIYLSPSVRTNQTIDLIVEFAKWENIGRSEKEDLYHASPSDYLNLIDGISENETKVCICAHNPGITDIVNYLSSGNIYNMPTCSLAIVTFKVDSWKEVSRGSGDLMHYDYPKNI